MRTAVEEQRIDWEAALIERAQRGDMRAFERLYRDHVGRVYGLCLRLTRGDAAAAEDCVQEAFINAWRALARFETRSAFGTWLHRIAVNVVLAKRRRPTHEVAALEDVETSEGELTFDTPVEVRELEGAIESLPEGARDVLVLCGLYGYSHGEAGQMLGIAEGTCKAQLHRARALIRAKLDVEERP
jgi:RNA polymerase sigma-70 factor (ECF subfamily)